MRELSCGLLSRALLFAALKTTFQHTGISAPLHDASLKMGTAKPKPKLRGQVGGAILFKHWRLWQGFSFLLTGFARTLLLEGPLLLLVVLPPVIGSKSMQPAPRRQPRRQSSCLSLEQAVLTAFPFRRKEKGLCWAQPPFLPIDPAARWDAVHARKCHACHSCLPGRAHSLLGFPTGSPPFHGHGHWGCSTFRG